MPSSKSAATDAPSHSDTDAGEAILRLAAIHAACMAMSDAAAHLRRTSIMAEAASVAALTRSLQAGADSQGWQDTLTGAEQMMKTALLRFVETSQAALSIAAAPVGTPPSAP